MKFVIYKEIDTAELMALTPLLRQGFELSTGMPRATAHRAVGTVRRGSGVGRVGSVRVVRVSPDKPVTVTRRSRRHRQLKWSDDMILAALQMRASGLKWRIVARRLGVKCTGGAVSQVCHKRMATKTAAANEQCQAQKAGA
jgi:hypothetical protein